MQKYGNSEPIQVEPEDQTPSGEPIVRQAAGQEPYTPQDAAELARENADTDRG